MPARVGFSLTQWIQVTAPWNLRIFEVKPYTATAGSSVSPRVVGVTRSTALYKAVEAFHEVECEIRSDGAVSHVAHTTIGW